jgi:hypothetical protein
MNGNTDNHRSTPKVQVTGSPKMANTVIDIGITGMSIYPTPETWSQVLRSRKSGENRIQREHFCFDLILEALNKVVMPMESPLSGSKTLPPTGSIRTADLSYSSLGPLKSLPHAHRTPGEIDRKTAAARRCGIH